MEEQVVVHGGKCNLPANTFSLEGYRFAGWSETESGPVVYADGAEVTVTEDMTLYAVWEWDKYKVRLHGNGATTPEGQEWVDVVMTLGKPQALPDNPFKPKDVMYWYSWGNLLGWSLGKGTFQWPTSKLKDLVSARWSAYATAKILPEWAKWGWVDVSDGWAVLHLWAIWGSTVKVEIHDEDGNALSPKSLAEHVKCKIEYDNYWMKNGEEASRIPPGTHRVALNVDSRWAAYAGTWEAWMKGKKLERDEAGGYKFTIASEAGPLFLPLEVRVTGKTEAGRVRFRCVGKMTKEQEEKMKNWPAFDANQVGDLWIQRNAVGEGELKVEAAEWKNNALLLPEGEYAVEGTYSPGDWASLGWGVGCLNQKVVVKGGKEQTVDLEFWPGGSSMIFPEDDEEQGWFSAEQLEWLRVQEAGTASVRVPMNVTKIKEGTFAGGASLASISFMGNAPEVEAGALDGLPETAVVRVARGTTGWGEVPGTWQGRTLAYDSLAELDAGASAEKVATALSEVAAVDGARIAAAVGGDAAAYASFREWAQSVKGGETAALDSPHAAASWKLGAVEPLANEPVAVLGLPTDVDVVGGATVVSVAVHDGDEVAEVDSERVAGMIETAASPLDWSEGSRLLPSIEATSAGEDGELQFSVLPGEEGMPAAFFRLRME